MKNLKEEILRIKKLFTEELLWGNLIKEQNPDADGDKIITSVEFNAIDPTGNFDANDKIDVDIATDFIKGSGLNVVKKAHDSDRDKNVQHLCYSKSNMKKFYTDATTAGSALVTASIDTQSFLINNFSSSDGLCYFYIKRRTDFAPGDWGIQKLIFWQDNTITFYVKLPYPIIMTTKALAADTLPKTTLGLKTQIGTNELVSVGAPNNTVAFIKYEAQYDTTTHTYHSTQFVDFRKGGLKKISMYGTTLLDTLEEGGDYGYSYRITPGDPSSLRKYDPPLNLKTILETGLDVDLNGDGKKLIEKML